MAQFITTSGKLPVGQQNQYYALPNRSVNFQIEVSDYTDSLYFYVKSGSLPPGLRITSHGAITGTTQYVATYHSYSFTIAVNDRTSEITREFTIIVINSTYFRTDISLTSDSGLFTSDAFNISLPVWITDSTIPPFRYNQQLILPTVAEHEKTVYYEYSMVNSDIITISYRYETADNLHDSHYLTILHPTGTPVINQVFTLYKILSETSQTIYKITHVQSLGNDTYRLTLDTALEYTIPDNTTLYIGDLSQLPANVIYDETSGTIYGFVSIQPIYLSQYKFTIFASVKQEPTDITPVARLPRIFTLTICDKLYSDITWITNPDLGTIKPGIPCIITVQATADNKISYTLNGTLPNGLTFYNGEISGKVLRGPVQTEYTFDIIAKNRYNLTGISRTFTITVDRSDATNYDNVYLKMFLPPKTRSAWQAFIDSNIFDPEYVYRPQDSSFGINRVPEILLYSGLEQMSKDDYFAIVREGDYLNKIKHITFKQVKRVNAIDPNTNQLIYELVYVKLCDLDDPDDSEEGNIYHSYDDINEILKYNENITSEVEVANEMFNNSITGWRHRLRETGKTEYLLAPLWMRTIQKTTRTELGYDLALPLCYCKPGYGDILVQKINASGFDFKLLDFTVDRYIVRPANYTGTGFYVHFV